MLDAGNAELCCVSGCLLFATTGSLWKREGGDVLVDLEKLAIKLVRQQRNDWQVLPESPCVS